MAAGLAYLDWLLTGGDTADLGVVYLIHFDQRIGNLANPRATAGHYIGFSADPPKRFSRHTAGQGAAIMRAVRAQGITWQVAATWPGDRRLERKLKNRKHASRFCPICRADAVPDCARAA